MRLRAENVDTFEQLRDWSRRLDRYGRASCSPLRRFAIGFYQIYQGYDWAGSDSEYESYAAAAIHFIACTEAFEIPIEDCFGLQYINDLPFGPVSDKLLLYNISKLQGQIVYATNHAKIKRKSRFDRGTSAILIADIVRDLFKHIPPTKRKDAIYKAMEIMTGEL